MAGEPVVWSGDPDEPFPIGSVTKVPRGPARPVRRRPRGRRPVPGKLLDQCLGWLRLHGRDGTLPRHNGGTAGYRSLVGVRDTGAVAVLTAADRSVDRVGIRLLEDLA